MCMPPLVSPCHEVCFRPILLAFVWSSAPLRAYCNCGVLGFTARPCTVCMRYNHWRPVTLVAPDVHRGYTFEAALVLGQMLHHWEGHCAKD